mmetsp:Transcript_26673/g.67206  ORF Transcript_26673/g.67206 Transcript_26673/m.67206 type:complete len:236 (-) Transcript_26673:855-1562(-)
MLRPLLPRTPRTQQPHRCHLHLLLHQLFLPPQHLPHLLFYQLLLAEPPRRLVRGDPLHLLPDLRGVHQGGQVFLVKPVQLLQNAGLHPVGLEHDVEGELRHVVADVSVRAKLQQRGDREWEHMEACVVQCGVSVSVFRVDDVRAQPPEKVHHLHPVAHGGVVQRRAVVVVAHLKQKPVVGRLGDGGPWDDLLALRRALRAGLHAKEEQLEHALRSHIHSKHHRGKPVLVLRANLF